MANESQSISKSPQSNRWTVFLCSVFFVLGFSLIFSLVGVLLQSVLSSIAYDAQKWLARIGGIIIILFGLYLTGLLKLAFLEKERKFKVKKVGGAYTTSFLFGAAFAVGWTPCVGAVLGAILTLAATNPSSAFFLLFSYTLGLGIPFLIVGLFVNQIQGALNKIASAMRYVNIFFGILLIIMGILIFTENLARIANFEFATTALQSLDVGGLSPEEGLNMGIAFLAGILSFLSPCVLPIVPGFLSYLASLASKREEV